MTTFAQSDASGHPKTTLNFTQSGLTTSPDRLGLHPLPFNPCLAHARPHRRPESKIHPDRTKLAHTKYITALTKNGHSAHNPSQMTWLASLSNSYIKSFHLRPKSRVYYINGCLGVILREMTHPNSSFMNISAQSDASQHSKTTLNVTQSGLTTFPERLRLPPLPFNPCFAHARPQRRPESKIRPNRTKSAQPNS